jgi:hypothetical protein
MAKHFGDYFNPACSFHRPATLMMPDKQQLL